MKKKYDIALRPIHYACVSGGKDSLYMLGVILKNLDKYPLERVINYDLEIDWGWVKKSVNQIEAMCNKSNIPFWRIKPRKNWNYWYEKYYMATRRVRWCNSYYKMDAERQMIEWIQSQNCRPVAYIGFCADEKRRFKYELGNWEKGTCCYPLAEEGITEDKVLEWAKTNPIFSDWYKYFKRQGCMMCPMLTMKEMAYMYKYENESFEKYFYYISEWEKKFNKNYYTGKNPSSVIKKRVIEKWVKILDEEENQFCFYFE